MMITVTPAARTALAGLPVTGDNVIRLDADMSGGCGISVAFSVKIDEARRGDQRVEGFHVDAFTARYIDDLTIDWTDEDGFRFSDQFDSNCSI